MNTTKHRQGWEAGVAPVLRGWLLAALLSGVSAANAQVALHTTRNLEFGKFVAGAGGTLSVDTNGMRSRSGGVVLLSSSAASASFNVSDATPANANKVYLITLPGNGTAALTSGANSMTLSNFVSAPSATGMLTGGSQVVLVGATLSVGANQPPGNYSGTFMVTVEYQ